ncbi:MAG: hypothetical protein E7612_10760 [Ruminococcaceae bacterium]|nr:hypothetical protein [Oscillospiraceae bacterium]
MINLSLLILSIVLSTGRNILSKNLSDIRFGTRRFFLCQSILFLCGGAALVTFGKISFDGVALSTVGYAVSYGALLILAQWFYTAALAKGNTALCSTVYSLGFIFPTLSGAFFWSEPFSVLDALGIVCAAAAVVSSGLNSKSETKTVKAYYFLPLIIAMLASGGLGIVQKLQQKSAYAEQKSVFLFTAFMLAAAASLLVAAFSKKENVPSFSTKKLSISAGIGICFGCCNLLNTTLAGRLPSAVFFPTLNIGVILLSMLCGLMLFKEKLSKKDITVLILGGISILLLNLG